MNPVITEVEQLVENFIRSQERQKTLTTIRNLPAREATYGEWPESLSQRIAEAVRTRGIEQLYSHQSLSIGLALAGKNVVVVTPTASGKTLCYNLPVLHDCLQDLSSRALYLFPTKALAQDQLAELQETIDVLDAPIKTFTYDGDTPDDARRAIRAQGHIVVTNPDMLHTGILPHHSRWAKLFQSLRYVVIDELHTYRGVFGSHLCNVLRRLRRVADFYGASPTFIMCSATIANPQELAEKLIEAPVHLVDENGAPQGEKTIIFYNPPVLNAELGIRRSYLSAARWIASQFLRKGRQTITFATSRLNVEVLTKYLKEDLERSPGTEGLIRGYRGGYLPNTRREIERGLRSGKVLGVVGTNALELGIDIGNLDVAVLAGYPGTVASTWQQAGRAGRRQGASVAILVARSDPLDQFIVSNPDYFFGQPPEHGLINPDNLLILLSHIKCAAFELPFQAGEKFGKENLEEILRYLEEEKVLHFSGGRWHWMKDVYPADGVSLRSVSTENFVIMDLSHENKVIAEVDYRSAPTTIYEDAIYMVESRPYNVKRLDYAQRRAYVKSLDAEYYTEAITNTSVRILDIFETTPVPSARKECGEVHVAWRVSGFKKIRFHTRENVGYGEVNLPDQEMHTTAYWFTLDQTLLSTLPYTRAEILDGIVGLAYTLHHVAPFYLMCDVRDIDRCVGDRNAKWFMRSDRDTRGRYTFSEVSDQGPAFPEPGKLNRAEAQATVAAALDGIQNFEPTIFLYDNYPGGIGFSPQLYDAHSEILVRSLRVIVSCPCEGGCPSCVGPTTEVGARSKIVATDILKLLVKTCE